MIKANELRIGNLLFMHDILVKVTSINENGFAVEPLQQEYVIGWTRDVECHGVPLTPEILEKCGFKNDNPVFGSQWELGDITMHEIDEGYKIFASEWSIGKTFYYLHQLQNILFDLFDLELEIKLQPDALI